MIVNQERLINFTDKTILVVGIGGVGGYVVESLVRSGVKKIIIVDHDTVDETNLNRQIIALKSTIGNYKTDVLKKRIKDINEDCEVVDYKLFYNEETTDVIFNNKIDFIVDACDTIASKKLLIKEALNKEIPIISCMGTGNKFDPSLLEITDIRKTVNDPLAKIMRKWVKDERINKKITVLSSKELPVKTNNRKPGSTSFVPSSAGLLISSYIFRFYTK